MQYLLTLVAAVAVGATTITELNCATSFEVGDVVQSDRNPQAEMTAAMTNFIVRLPVALRDIYYMEMVNSSITVRSFTANGGPAAGVKSFTDLVTVMAQRPGHVVECATTRGCDGFVLDVLAFRRLFPLNATHYVMTFQVRWYTNTSSSGQHHNQRRLLGIPPDSAILIGTSDLETAEFNMTAALENQALATSTASDDKTWTYVGIALGSIFGALLLGALLMIWIRSGRQGREYKMQEMQPLQQQQPAKQPVAVKGLYGYHYGRSHTLGQGVA